MNVISEARPQRWNEVIGQETAIQVLHALLHHQEYMTRGFIFEGPWAVGKTSTAYLFAKALLCKGEDPLDCDRCDSCRIVKSDGLALHPSFKEVNAAQVPGVKEVREMWANQLDSAMSLSKRLVVIVDEAQRLSPEAFDAFLAPLEVENLDVSVIFITSEINSIPKPIMSRCAVLKFEPVSIRKLTGRIMRIADQRQFVYYLDGLEAIAKWSQGRPRDAEKGLYLVGALGEITPEAVEKYLNRDVSTECLRILTGVASGATTEIGKVAFDLALRIGPVKTITALFARYSHDHLGKGDGSAYRDSLAPLSDVTRFFLKWLAVAQLPVDVIPLFIAEMVETCRRSSIAGNIREEEQSERAPGVRVVSVAEFAALAE